MGGARRRDGRVPPLRVVELKSLVLVHGAGSGPWIFDEWPQAFPGVDIDAVDLQAGLTVEHASMLNYEAVATCTVKLLPRPLALVGWSMGGLVAMMATRRIEPAALVLLEPSPPSEVQGEDPSIEPRPGAFDPEVEYGVFPPGGIRPRRESALARAERKRGISVPTLSPPILVVHGDEFGPERGAAVAEFYRAEELHIPGALHWDLVLSPKVRDEVARWLGQAEAASSASPSRT